MKRASPSTAFTIALFGLLLTLSFNAAAASQKVLDPAGIQQLKNDTGNKARISISAATGGVRFITLPSGIALNAVAQAASPQAQSSQFLQQYGSIFGLKNVAAELTMTDDKTDQQGERHFTYEQFYQGVPVFAGIMKTHFAASGQLKAVNGNFIPDIQVNPNPSIKVADAEATALAKVAQDKGPVKNMLAHGSKLKIFRTGLAQGIPGENHLVFEVEVGNGADVREFVYIDAHTGKFVGQITGLYDALNRRAYDNKYLNSLAPAEYPDSPFWIEGAAFPTTGTCTQNSGQPPCNTEADNMIIASKETYDFFKIPFARDSFDGAGATIDAIFDRGNGCPNATWTGQYITFCPGTTTDDITSHELGHAYTEHTHGLIYQWQSGALNEAYSDIWGETVDMLNHRQTDSPATNRTTNSCSQYSKLAPRLVINSPAAIAKTYVAGSASFGPPLSPSGLTAKVVLVNDGVGTTTDACETITNAAQLAGNIALLDRGTCTFTVKVKNAQNAGAIAVIVANNAIGNAVINMGGADPSVTIPSLSVGHDDSVTIRNQLANTVNATLRAGDGQVIDDSYRWLLGEDATGFGGAIRDMWNPTCYNNPGKVTDTLTYTCLTTDSGGVHTNSGVPNHAYALIVDGGTYNGQTITGLGLTKAAHIYFRAMTVYQHPSTDFADHADAIEQAATDLIGVNLNDLTTGEASGEMITQQDVVNVHKAMVAAELRTPPVFCNFQKLLAQNAPALCADTTYPVRTLYLDDFETGLGAWTLSNQGVYNGWSQRDWTQKTSLPGQRAGAAAFAENIQGGTCTQDAGDVSGLMRLESGDIAITSSTVPRLAFDHYVATEKDYDGGNLKISINGSTFSVVPNAAYTFNPNNLTLSTTQNTNPLTGELGFSGSDGGSFKGSWSQSQINLSALGVNPGDTIRLRYDMGQDGCGSDDGWYVDNVRVYACENLPSYSVTTNASHGAFMPQIRASVTEGSATSFTVIPDPGYSIGSVTGCGGSLVGNAYTTGAITGNCEVSATFTLNSYALTVNKQGSGTVTSNTGGIDCGATCSVAYDYNSSVILSATPDTGYSFTGWSGGGCTGTDPCMVNVTQVTTVNATFAPDSNTLTVNKQGSGTVTSSPGGIDCGATCSASYDYNSAVILSATPDTGYSFTGWSGGGCAGTGTCTVNVTQATTVAATFTLNRYALTVNKQGSGTVTSNTGGVNCGTNCQADYDHGSQVTLTATASKNFIFGGWSGGTCSGIKTTCTLTVEAAQNVVAAFIPKSSKRTLSVIVNGIGQVSGKAINCKNTRPAEKWCVATYPFGSSVIVTAKPPKTKWHFQAWDGACKDSGNPCTVTFDADKSVSAIFVPDL